MLRASFFLLAEASNMRVPRGISYLKRVTHLCDRHCGASSCAYRLSARKIREKSAFAHGMKTGNYQETFSIWKYFCSNLMAGFLAWRTALVINAHRLASGAGSWRLKGIGSMSSWPTSKPEHISSLVKKRAARKSNSALAAHATIEERLEEMIMYGAAIEGREQNQIAAARHQRHVDMLSTGVAPPAAVFLYFYEKCQKSARNNRPYVKS